MVTVTADPPSPSGRIWFAIIAAPLAWAVQQWLVWFLDTHACSQIRFWGLSPAAARGWELAAAVATWAVAVAALVASLGAWRRSRDPDVEHVQGRTRPDYMAAVALLVSASFALATFWAGWPVLILRACEPLR